MAAARLARGRRAPVTGDGKGRVAELLLAPVHLTVVAATDGAVVLFLEDYLCFY